MSRNHQSQSCAPGRASLASDEEAGRTSPRGGRMRRRDFMMGLLLVAGPQSVRAQELAKQRRIAIVISTGPAASINDKALRLWQAFFEELRRSGDVEGQ